MIYKKRERDPKKHEPRAAIDREFKKGFMIGHREDQIQKGEKQAVAG